MMKYLLRMLLFIFTGCLFIPISAQDKKVQIKGNLQVDSLAGAKDRYLGATPEGAIIPMQIPHASVVIDSSKLILKDSFGNTRFVIDANNGEFVFYHGDSTYTMKWGNSVDMFLEIDGTPITGESQDAKHRGEIDVLAWSWGMSQSGSFHAGGGGGTGKVRLEIDSLTTKSKVVAENEQRDKRVEVILDPDGNNVVVTGDLETERKLETDSLILRGGGGNDVLMGYYGDDILFGLPLNASPELGFGLKPDTNSITSTGTSTSVKVNLLPNVPKIELDPGGGKVEVKDTLEVEDLNVDRISGSGVQLELLGQSLSGSFVFEKKTNPEAPKVKVGMSSDTAHLKAVQGTDTVGLTFLPGDNSIELGGNIDMKDDTITFTGLEKKPRIRNPNGNIFLEADTVGIEGGGLLQSDTIVLGGGLTTDDGVLKFDGGNGQIWSGSGSDFGNVEVKADTVEVSGDLVSFGLYSTQKGLRSLEPELKLSVTKSDGSTPEVLNIDSVGAHITGNLEVDGDVNFNGLTVIPVPWKMVVDSPETTPIPHLEYKGNSTVFKAIARGAPATDTVGLGWNMEDKKIDVYGDLEVDGKLSVADSISTKGDTLKFTGSDAWTWSDNATLDNLGNVELSGDLEIGGFVQLSGNFAFEKTTDPGEITVNGSADTVKLSLSPSGVLALNSDTDQWLLDYNRGADTLTNKITGYQMITVRDSDANAGNVVTKAANSGGAGNNENWDFGGTDSIEGRLSNNAGTEFIDIKYALAEGDVLYKGVDRFSASEGEFTFNVKLDTTDKEIIFESIDEKKNDTTSLHLGTKNGWKINAGPGSIIWDDSRYSRFSFDPYEFVILLRNIQEAPFKNDTLDLGFDFENLEVFTNGLLHLEQGIKLTDNTKIESAGTPVLSIGGDEEGIYVGRDYNFSTSTVLDHANSWALDGAQPMAATTITRMNLEPDRLTWLTEDLSGLGTVSVEIAPLDSVGFGGAMHVRGWLDAEGFSTTGPKLFKIDHPLDPTNKYLQHSCVESSEMMNIYHGIVKTDSEGFAEVKLPGYFTALNREYKYQLTVLGKTFARALVWEEIDDGGMFIIRSEVPGIKISWQVTGVRNDRYARENPMQVEIDKEPGMKGKLLYGTE